ncbi:MAG TPA: metallophosphoesterase family protein [Bryobacteraceae bacterium]|nr:metallophosphoesterase family protein [Bryobacteraceae bacterium]
MQYLILSDLHANRPALEAVLADAGTGYQQIICCGDLVGYNPAPGPVVDWTRQHCATVIRGNHDKVVAGLEQLDWFNEIAQRAARWTIEHLDRDQISYLAGLPAGPLRLEHFDIWHGSPRDEDEYVATPHDATACFAHFEHALAFFGHTHLQGGFFSKRGRIGSIRAVRKSENEATFEIEVDTLYMVNPGSVGQPRDGDPRAAYALFDSEQKTVTLRRVQYAVQQTAQDIVKAGLPDVLGLRLFRGL